MKNVQNHQPVLVYLFFGCFWPSNLDKSQSWSVHYVDKFWWTLKCLSNEGIQQGPFLSTITTTWSAVGRWPHFFSPKKNENCNIRPWNSGKLPLKNYLSINFGWLRIVIFAITTGTSPVLMMFPPKKTPFRSGISQETMLMSKLMCVLMDLRAK